MLARAGEVRVCGCVGGGGEAHHLRPELVAVQLRKRRLTMAPERERRPLSINAVNQEN